MRSLRLLPVLSVLLLACGAAPPAAPLDPSAPEGGNRAAVHPPGCRGSGSAVAPPGPDEAARQRATAAARASEGWGKGYRALQPPPGFHAVPVAKKVADGAADDGEDEVEVEAPADLVMKFEYDDHEYISVDVQVFDHPAARPEGQSLFRYAAKSFDANGEDITDEMEDDSFVRWFDRVAAFQDEKGRRIVEWAYVEKGCERGELYERFIEDGAHLWHVRMEVMPSAPEEDLLRWMAHFFDAPLASPAPADRRGLAGKETTR
ncbi:hypothetical protein [Polyangium mundeleinium]|uniref:Lipoprotein n=1 Tax=Polyangium mundeleinium TaxID=2995306 RepID=A0ABT5F1S5_9BACT|nr:hypothetical protein [Polyangium mundeleinium]MDC0748033.1 hypothetical protein [Polyangium mundeleinium]